LRQQADISPRQRVFLSPINTAPPDNPPMHIRLKHRHTVILFFIFCLSSCTDVTYQGKVTRVTDGDSLNVRTRYEPLKVRLAEIDAPEYSQPHGKIAKKALAKLIANKRVIVEEQTIDQYGRVVARLYIDKLDINAEMVKQGHAWAYREYSFDIDLYKLENEAKIAKRGLWALPESQRIPPWEWRNK